MSATPKILAFAGSARTGSFNKQFLHVGVATARSAGAEVTTVDLREYSLPLYDGDLEAREGLPESARRLKTLFLAHQGLLIASPEYNSSMTGVLKNTIDWVSRSAPEEAPLVCFRGKIAGLLSASPGVLGGLRSLVHVRSMLGNIGVLVIPEQVALPRAHEAFTPEGALKDAKTQAAVEQLVHRLTKLLVQIR